MDNEQQELNQEQLTEDPKAPLRNKKRVSEPAHPPTDPDTEVLFYYDSSKNGQYKCGMFIGQNNKNLNSPNILKQMLFVTDGLQKRKHSEVQLVKEFFGDEKFHHCCKVFYKQPGATANNLEDYYLRDLSSILLLVENIGFINALAKGVTNTRYIDQINKRKLQLNRLNANAKTTQKIRAENTINRLIQETALSGEVW